MLAFLAGASLYNSPPSARRTTGLPAHLGIGLSAPPGAGGLDGWLPESGIPFDYADKYLSGGVNTGTGWRDWSEVDRFPLDYATNAVRNGYVPAFSYYQLLQSSGPCRDCSEARTDLTNLGDSEVMERYFVDFTQLMKRLGPGEWEGVRGFGGTAIVHVEPDLSGYAQQAVLDPSLCFGFCGPAYNDPASLRAAVASSGNPDLIGLPDSWPGFVQALARLRDRYAPNVLLGYYVSGWAALDDVGSSTDPRLDPVALATQVSSFALASGAARYDLVFNDLANRDAGYEKYEGGKPDAFWDQANLAVPDFARWENYLGAILAAVAKPGIVWQVPFGNQWSRTMDNTPGHYQDNRAEYLFGHTTKLSRLGVIALLFGAPHAGSTTNTDATGDGVTNPAPTCTVDGTSGAQICPVRVALVSDDDGGYFRHASAAYYRSGPVSVTTTR